MKSAELTRRNLLKMTAATGIVLATSQLLPKFSWANVKQVSLEQCEKMSPEEIAGSSRLVMDSWQYLLNTIQTIENDEVRRIVDTIISNPAPTFIKSLMEKPDRKRVYNTLIRRKFLPETIAFEEFLPPTHDPTHSTHTFFAAPGSGYTSHHSYPGGLVNHVALNIMTSLALVENYQTIYGSRLDNDIVIASQILHDLHKPWVFQWQPNGASRTEMKLADTGEHHTYGIAESIVRGLPAEVCVAQACAHNHPGWAENETDPVNWLKAAAIFTDMDPVAAGLLAPGGDTLPLPRRMENFVCHLGDHDWVLSAPAAKWLIPIMKEIAIEQYGMTLADLQGRKFNQLRNYVFAQSSIMNLYELYSTQGKDALTSTVLSMVTA